VIDVRVTGLGILTFPEGTPNAASKVTGIVDTIYVHLNQKINKGDLIAYIYQPDLDIQEKTLKDELDSYVNTHKRMLQLETTNLNDSLTAFDHQMNQLKDSIELTNQQIKIYQVLADSYQTLYNKGIVSEQDFDQANITVLNAQAALKTQNVQLQSIIKSISDSKTNYQSTIEQRELNINNQKSQIEQMNQRREQEGKIFAPCSGTVCEISVAKGQNITVNQTVVLIEEHQDSDTSVAENSTVVEVEAVIYVTSINAKKVLPGQQTLISPTIIRPSEYGTVTGKVRSISDYPVTQDRLTSMLPNSVLEQQFLTQGSVFEIHITMDRSANSPSGYHWTGGEGPDIRLNSGTLTNAMICVEQRRPISYLIPFLDNLLLGKDSYGVYWK
jgi:HlyD family secretion protein